MPNGQTPPGGGEGKLERQLKKGVLEMLVLRLISRGPTYGYELMLRVDAVSGGYFKLREGTLYPILYRLEDEGLIAAGWQTGAGRAAPRKIYTLTEAGRAAADAHAALWRSFSAHVDLFFEEDAP